MHDVSPFKNRTFVLIVFKIKFKINTFSRISCFRFFRKQEISPKSTKDAASEGIVFFFDICISFSGC
ncbi:hypothetical protein BSUW23_09765 [Bacillus spizizenii str. W23]|uniref:Uncharacterized protein n=1 Tax=Bacillus spizizenii (strain ATCC 23059 / NRRL B-14472 / W23) TaxID=655816 RepID=E0TXZ9_BACSH|nr:hypothetical protein BSUW23_09765 [Bacillus spizizenii str. W23]AJW87325.1 hypothetical protein BIS30_20325 [Bacillus spizizenii]EFG93141.1 hypothetical protein BSU6633_05789 [Bacillus spizizenii ATCC 6633 = JCM 2499]QCJ17184.1 hypothetical protein FA024_08505 [Bacillus subtilis]MBE0174258.1 hypothetical protein [Bacillus spizizenii]